MHRIKSIFAITDLTIGSDAAVASAANIARATGAALHVTNALPGLVGFMEFARMTFAPQRYGRERAALMEEQLARTTDGLPAVNAEVNVDASADLLMQQARDCGAELVVLGDSLNAEIVESVIERSGIPAMIVSKKLHLPVRRVVLPITTALPDQHVIGAARAWAERLNSRATNGTCSYPQVELELLQMTYIFREPGTAAGAIRAVPPSSAHGPQVTVSWRSWPAESSRKQMRRLTSREDIDLLIAPLQQKRGSGGGGRLSALQRATLSRSRSATLFIPVRHGAPAARPPVRQTAQTG